MRFWLLLLALFAFGCSGSSPVTATASEPVNFSQATPNGDLLVGPFTVRVNPATLGVTVDPPARSTSSQPPQNLRYDLDIAQFMTPRTLEPIGVRITPRENLELTLRHSHPFAAPNVANPISATNRADLGYTGRLLILAESTSRAVTVDELTWQFDPFLVRNPDGYLEPKDLLRDSPLTNDTFPYLLLADEARDNREGITNGGLGSGNYNPAIGGWQRANAGAGNGWTGYDYIHAGQSTVLTLELDRPQVDLGVFQFQVALLIQYTDPRGVTGRDARFPAEPSDPAQFAYRLPHAALDVSQLGGCEQLLLSGEPGATVRVHASLRDWDAAAIAADDADLSDESDVSLVMPGEPGTPEVVLRIPGFDAAPIAIPQVGGTGTADDPFRYEAHITNAAAVSPGEYWGVYMAIDPESSDANRDSYHFGVDPETLAADPARALPAHTLYPVQLQLTGSTSWVRTWGDGSVEDASDVFFDADGVLNVTGEVYSAANDVEPGRCLETIPVTGTNSFHLTRYDRYGNRLDTTYWTGTGYKAMYNALPDAAGNIYLNGWFENTLDLDPGPGVDERTSLERAAWLVKLNPDRKYAWGTTWAEEGRNFPGALVIDESGIVLVGGAFRGENMDFDPGPGTLLYTADEDDAFISRFDAATGAWLGTHVWPATEYDDITDLLSEPAGGYIATADLAGNSGGVPFDIDPGPGELLEPVSPGGSALLMRFDGAGVLTWHQLLFPRAAPTPLATGYFRDIARDSQDRLVVLGRFSQEADFDPGPLDEIYDPEHFSTAQYELFLQRYSASGEYEWTRHFPDLDDQHGGGELAVDTTDGPVIYAIFSSEGDFDPGPGEVRRTPASPFFSPFLLGLTAGGEFNYVRTWDMPYNSWGSDVTFDSLGNVVLCGYYNGYDFDFDPEGDTFDWSARFGWSDGFLLRLQPDGSW